MRRWLVALTAVLAAATMTSAVTLVAATPSAAHAPYCGIRWGSLPKQAGDLSSAHLVNVRAGRHACFERLVVDYHGDADGYRVRYVSTVREDGSGNAVPLRGGARLEIIALAPAYDDDGDPTYTPKNPRELVNVKGWRTFRQIAWAGSFEGQTTIGLGVRARLPFRAFTLDGPGSGSRLVIDVAHKW